MNFKIYILLFGLFIGFSSCEKDQPTYEETRLFRPVLASPLLALANEIDVNVGKLVGVTSYTYELSRDSFVTIDHTIKSDTNRILVGKEILGGTELFWNTIYQIRATAHAPDPQYDSRAADLGSIRTQRFPSIINVPSKFDVTDVKARVTWILAGAPVTKIKAFSGTDLGLATVLKEFDVDAASQTSGEAIVAGLAPSTHYQLAIYSAGDVLRGWVDYMTFEAEPVVGSAGVIDLTENENPEAVSSAVSSAADGDIIMVKRGVQYDLPSDALDKSITIRGAYGFGPQKAILYTTGNWNFVEGSTIDHVRFVGLEIRGEDSGGDYVFNPNLSVLTNVGELSFDDCFITNLRGICRIRSMMFLGDFNIRNSIVSEIGNYGLFTADTDGDDQAAVDNILFENSTFSRIFRMIQSRQNSQSITIESCTFNEFTVTGDRVFRYRGSEGKSNVLNGVSITNCIWGHGWDQGEAELYDVRFIAEGLEATNFNLVNNYGTSKFEVGAGFELAGFPSTAYLGTVEDLFVDPYDGQDFTIKDPGFAGRFDSGDPRWRPTL